MDDLYLDNIDEYVNDQNKVVTYKWLSLTLGVHVNIAKQMLYHYLDQRRKESSGTTLHATFLVSGKCLENGTMCHKVSVVREDKLEDVKSKLDKPVSVHVYSVQKAELKDSGPLYNTDYDAVKENLKNCNRYSAICCATAVPVSSSELQKASATTPQTVADKEGSKADQSIQASKTQVKQPKGIMGMFSSKAIPKPEEPSREVKKEQRDDGSAVEESKNKVSSKVNTMNNFFGKPAEKKVANAKDIKEEDKTLTSSAAASVKQPRSSPKPEQDIKPEVQKQTAAEKGDSKDKRSKSKRLEHSESEEENVESQKKKRRRIKKPEPDSSDEEVIPDSPPGPEVQMPSPENTVKKEPVSHRENSEGRRRKRRRVLKNRMFVDEEGCMVTEKVYESESYSDSEDDFKPRTRPSEDSGSLKQSLGKREEERMLKEKGQKKASNAANKTTKQASIMGFFHKK